jgi:hypothetical protein
LALLLALAGCGDNRPGATGELELQADRSSVKVYGSAILSGAAPGIDRVELEADVYPFGRFEEHGSKTADADGRYEFSVSPDRNTRYRVVDPAGHATPSAPQKIFVSPRLDVTPRRVGPHTALIRVRAQVAPRATMSPGGVYVYLGRPNHGPHRLLGRVRLRRRGPYADATGSARFRVERFSQADRLFLCTPEPLAKGMADDAFGAGCGRKTIVP